MIVYWDLEEQYGYLDGQDVSMDGLDNLLFTNSIDIFFKSIFVEPATIMRINTSNVLNAFYLSIKRFLNSIKTPGVY